uniref:BCNT-C domain-containing protein n=1 Tax=Polytomella parva TaxID=51329 RepID=A0A7S0V343_9CHLO|mmetsp:Transcript_28765/g.52835  ORF Transcript_28765/g.52835 Transcript_28765/m.52835 type:complete len:307 (+) Transcript_28765:19-939(+)
MQENFRMSPVNDNNNDDIESSEEDEDYVPNDDVEAEDRNNIKRKLDNDDVDDKMLKKIRPNEHSMSEILKKNKRDELWKQLNNKIPSSKSSLVNSNVSLAALCAPAKKTTPVVNSKGISAYHLPGTKLPASSTAEHAKELSTFSCSPSLPSSLKSLKQSSDVPLSSISDNKKREIAAAALNAVRDSLLVTAPAEQDKSSTLASNDGRASETGSNSTAPSDGNSTGLDAILAELDKKKKTTVLEKTRSDWKDFKSQNVTVDDELEAYKRSNDQFLERQEFLKRTELREYETERDKKLASDIRTRGRL